MASIGRVASSLMSANNENTLALANINFDFSLWKVEAPKEFRPISDSLTSQRRETAEDGALHQTARRLGSLFHDLIPKTPKLIQAYGQRASEISKHVDSTSKDQKTKNFGPFEDYLGLDATTIWAGATSGNSAIAIHLLACMLARTWKGPEAISIWSELVAERRKEIETQGLAGEAFAMGTMMAARQELRREDLASWDAGARAWLMSADKAKKKEQTQLMLIVKNVEIAVSNKAAMYPSVLGAWQAAMNGVENVLNGVPQRVQNGAVLLGLTAWHIFPDIVVLGKPMTEVRFGDPLVPAAGLLEIGIAKTDHKDNQGVFWSLSIAHLRYYGAPVAVERSVTYDESRVSFNQLYIVALGSVVAEWSTGKTDESYIKVFRFIRNLGEKLEPFPKTMQDAWLSDLFIAASTMMNATGLEARYASLLFSYGRHQGKKLIGETHTLFGLDKYSTLLRMAEDVESEISVLRSVARALRIPNHLCIIRYRSHSKNNVFDSFDYASCGELPISLERKQEEIYECHLSDHCRWIERYARSIRSLSDHRTCLDRQCTCIIFNDQQTNCLNYRSSCYNYALTEAGKDNHPTVRKKKIEIKPTLEAYHALPYYVMCQHERDGVRTKKYLSSSDPYSPIRESRNYPVWTESIRHQKFYLVLSAKNSAELFVSSEVLGEQDPAYFIDRASTFEDPEYSEIIKSLSAIRLNTYFNNMVGIMELLPLQSLQALSLAALLYQSYPDATFPLRICSQSLGKACWIREINKRDTRLCVSLMGLITRSDVFSCLAYFESGTYDISPDALNFVMAMSFGDTLYISECLLCDPAVTHDHTGIRRAMGNVGRPGISMLVSPGSIQIRPQRMDSWMLVDPAPFDGTQMDNFSSTSMHLTFTGYELPLGYAPTGGRDIEAALVETVVSVLDSGQWVADLDILSRSISDGPCIFDMSYASAFHVFNQLVGRKLFGDPIDCKHDHTVPEAFPFHSIDTWDGLLADLDSAGIVRTHKNRVARFVTAAVSFAKGYRVCVLPPEFCWKCLVEIFGPRGYLERSSSTVIIM